MSLWSVEAYLVIPVGMVSLVLLLSDVRQLQLFAISICSVSVALGRVRLSVSSIFALLATLICIIESVYTIPALTGGRFGTKPIINATTTTTVEMADRLRMKEWRNDRNWWISLYACTIWLIVWRLQIWTNRYCLVKAGVGKGEVGKGGVVGGAGKGVVSAAASPKDSKKCD